MQLALWGALALVLLWAYRHLRLPSVPWLAAYHVLGLVLGWLPRLVFNFIEFRLEEGVMFEMSDGLSTWAHAAGIISDTLSDAMVAWFLVAEFAFVISKPDLLWPAP